MFTFFPLAAWPHYFPPQGRCSLKREGIICNILRINQFSISFVTQTLTFRYLDDRQLIQGWDEVKNFGFK